MAPTSITPVATRALVRDWWAATVYKATSRATSPRSGKPSSHWANPMAQPTRNTATGQRPGSSWFGLNSVVAFWFAYVVTRPLGASFADYFSKPHSLSGANYGDATVAAITTIIVAVLVGYLTVTRRDIQRPEQQEPGRFAAVRDDMVGR